MQPNQPYTSPPPQQIPEQNPYDFILNNNEPPKKGLLGLPSGNSTKQRVFIVGGGLLLLLVVGLLFMSFLGGGGKSNTEQLTSLAQTQTEVVRVADLVAKEPSIRNEDTRTLALNTSLSVGSTKQQTVAMITKSGKKINEKQLGIGKNTKTDTVLTNALQNNQYDEVAMQVLKTSLKNYRIQLRESYNAVINVKDKKVLSDAFKGTGLLLGTEAETKTQ